MAARYTFRTNGHDRIYRHSSSEHNQNSIGLTEQQIDHILGQFASADDDKSLSRAIVEQNHNQNSMGFTEKQITNEALSRWITLNGVVDRQVTINEALNRQITLNGVLLN